MNLGSMKWNMEHRMIAEKFLLSPSIAEFAQSVAQNGSDVEVDAESGRVGLKRLRRRLPNGVHYCMFFIDHNLYDCPTPSSVYTHHPRPLLPLRTRDNALCHWRLWSGSFRNHTYSDQKDHGGRQCISRLDNKVGEI